MSAFRPCSIGEQAFLFDHCPQVLSLGFGSCPSPFQNLSQIFNINSSLNFQSTLDLVYLPPVEHQESDYFVAASHPTKKHAGILTWKFQRFNKENLELSNGAFLTPGLKINFRNLKRITGKELLANSFTYVQRLPGGDNDPEYSPVLCELRAKQQASPSLPASMQPIGKLPRGLPGAYLPIPASCATPGTLS
eukprot:468721-Pelagomonas_calceolata.AAC.1